MITEIHRINWQHQCFVKTDKKNDCSNAPSYSKRVLRFGSTYMNVHYYGIFNLQTNFCKTNVSRLTRADCIQLWDGTMSLGFGLIYFIIFNLVTLNSDYLSTITHGYKHATRWTCGMKNIEETFSCGKNSTCSGFHA